MECSVHQKGKINDCAGVCVHYNNNNLIIITLWNHLLTWRSSKHLSKPNNNLNCTVMLDTVHLNVVNINLRLLWRTSGSWFIEMYASLLYVSWCSDQHTCSAMAVQILQGKVQLLKLYCINNWFSLTICCTTVPNAICPLFIFRVDCTLH